MTNTAGTAVMAHCGSDPVGHVHTRDLPRRTDDGPAPEPAEDET